MISISVITATVRPGGLPLVYRTLKNQDFKSFEWLIGSKFKPGVDCEHIWVKDDFTGGFWSLNRIMNKAISKAKGDLIISIQDYTYAKYDCLSRFWSHFEDEPNILVTAVGNKYESIYPEIGAMVWKDPREREDQGTYYLCNFDDIEWNLCSCPKDAILSVGGFDEELDRLGFGMDGFSVNERLSMLGKYDFKIDQTIKSYSVPHDRLENWEKHNNIHGNYQKRKDFYVKNGPKLKYI